MPAVSPSPSRECGGTAGGRQCQQVECGGTAGGRQCQQVECGGTAGGRQCQQVECGVLQKVGSVNK